MKKYFFPFFLFFSVLASGQPAIDVQHYRFEISLSDESDAITGKAFITVKFLEDAAQVKFDLSSIDNDKGMYAFDVRDETSSLKTTHTNDVLVIYLEKPAKKGDVRVFEINYMGTPKDGLIISKNKYGDRTFFADNWPNRAHNWIPCNDRPDDKASFEFLVKVPDEYQVISNGVMVKTASLESPGHLFHWVEATPLSTKVMVIGVAKFAVKIFKDSPDSIPISAWVYPQDSAKGFYDYAVAPSIVKFFSNYIAAFPYKKLANVQSKTIFGGMENASAIFYAETSVTGDRKWEEVLAHEIAHQWFGDMASEKSFAHLWLSEGFATYLTDIYYEKTYGKSVANARLGQERQDIIAFVKTNQHAVVDSTKDLMSLLNVNSYQKGSWVLHMLRHEVGDTIFRKIIQNYYQQYKGSNAETRDFEKVAETIAGRDLKWFFDQWLYQPGVPKLKIRWKRISETSVHLTVEQEGNYVYHFPLTVGSGIEGNKMYQTITVSKKSESFLLKFSERPVRLVLDPDTVLLFDGTVVEEK